MNDQHPEDPLSILSCSVCYKVFLQESDYLRHMKLHEASANNNVNKAGKVTSKVTQKPVGNHKSRSSITCTKCLKTFTTVSHLKQHIYYKHTAEGAQKTPIKMSEIIIDDNTEDEPSGNADTTNSLNNTQCKLCSKSFSSPRYLKLHMFYKHSIGKPQDTTPKPNKDKLQNINDTSTDENQCSICFETFEQTQNLKLHMLYKHSYNKEAESSKRPKITEVLIDEYIDESVKNDIEMKKQTYKQCSICLKSFPRQKRLEQHMLTKHPFITVEEKKVPSPQVTKAIQSSDEKVTIRQYQCSLCSKTFKQLHYLNQHCKFKHSDLVVSDVGSIPPIEIFKCFVCGDIFHDIPEFDKHMSSHDLSTEIVNEVREFPQHYLSVEMDEQLDQTDSPEYSTCDICFLQIPSNNLQDHKDSHCVQRTSVRCPNCSTEYMDNATLVLHLKMLHEAPLSGQIGTEIHDYFCDICQRGFVSKFVLRRHVKNKHPSAVV